MSRERKIPKKRPATRDRRVVYQTLRRISNADTRNIIRGVLGKDADKIASSEGVNLVRRHADYRDLALAAELLLGREGAFPFKNTNGTHRNLLMRHSLAPIDSEGELIFVLGHLNGWDEDVQKILGAITTLAPLSKTDPADAMGALHAFAQEWGASNFLAKKVAFVMACAKENRSSSLNASFAQLAELNQQTRYPSPYFVALEMMDLDFPYFPASNTRLLGSRKYIREGDFRQLLHLNNVLPCPVSFNDVGPFIRKAHSMSLVDEVVAVLQLMHVGTDWHKLTQAIAQWLKPNLRRAFEEFAAAAFDPADLYSDVEAAEADFAYYRRSLAFVEFSGPARYRFYVDRILAPRLLPGLTPELSGTSGYPVPSKRDLTKALVGFRQPNDYLNFQSTGTFLRTVYFLLFLNYAPIPYDLDAHDIRFILERTVSLDILMTETELEHLYVFSDEESKPLITVLALALYKSRAADADVDFKFRFNLSMTVLSQFNGQIRTFIEWLLPSTPYIANFLLQTLDRSTLQKLYWLITSADQADTVRQSILQAVGEHLKRIDYFIEADAIEAQRQVSKLRQYFDDSRMYVDSIALKKWLVENATSYTQEYSRIIEHHLSAVKARAVIIKEDGNLVSAVAKIEAPQAFDYILKEVAKTAFEQFCLNSNFGIESYLGRRIRHNTLTGTMMGGVDTLIDQPHYQALSFDGEFVSANDAWLESYSALLKRMRLEILQFKTKNSKGIFSSELNFEDASTTSNIAQLRTLAFAGRSADVFHELLIRFCWAEIDTQLDAASKLITVDLLNIAKASIDEHFGRFLGDQHRRYRDELWNAVHERFSRLGSWFRQPESGFVSASTRQLGNLVTMEVTNHALLSGEAIAWDGDAVDMVLDGLSVHRLYDCLSVLIRNAIAYREPDSEITVRVDSVGLDNANLGRLRVVVMSELPKHDGDKHALRLRDAFSAMDLDTSMAKEGYSGIKKLRFITTNSEGKATAEYQILDNLCVISFTLTVELIADT